MLDVICWKWKPNPGYRSKFSVDTVNVLRRMVARNLSMPHRFSCITDDSKGIDPEVRVIPLWNDFSNVPSPSGAHNPSCYRRLRMFAPDAVELIGERIVSMDLDTVITGSLDPLFDRPEDFVIWGGQSVQPKQKILFNWYNGSLMMLRAGTRTQVWDKFDPKRSPMEAHRANSRGSDQGWITYCLGKGEAIWTDKDGVLSYRSHIAVNGNRLPPGARVVNFHGRNDPWNSEIYSRCTWIREHYR